MILVCLLIVFSFYYQVEHVMINEMSYSARHGTDSIRGFVSLCAELGVSLVIALVNKYFDVINFFIQSKHAMRLLSDNTGVGVPSTLLRCPVERPPTFDSWIIRH